MQVFGFGKRRPTPNTAAAAPTNGPDDMHFPSPPIHSRQQQQSPPPPSPPVHGQQPPLPSPAHPQNRYSASPGLMRSPLEESPIEKSPPVSASLDRMNSQTASLNTGDPVAMHLLMETAMVDSKKFEVLPFEEVEEIKRERVTLQNRIEATKRKLALERKLRDAAQSLNRLYSPKGGKESEELTREGSRRSLSHRSGPNDILNRTDDEFAASNRKCDALAEELFAMEKRSEELSKRILEHTAGILQLTHKGLKKNIRRENLPRSPESMASVNHKSMANFDGLEDFDDRSLYRGLDQFDEQNGANRKAELQLLEQTEKQLDDLNNRIRGMVLQADPDQQLNLPPQNAKSETGQQSGVQILAHLEYLGQALESMEAAQSRTVQEAQRSVFDSEDQMEDINLRLHEMLQKTNKVVQSPMGIAPDSRGKSLQSQLSFSNMVLEKLDQRVEHLVEQKDILSRQIQQQRQLNSKSDAQRDSQIMELTQELSNAKDQQALHEEETKAATNQIHLLMEQLDSSRQESILKDQKRQSEDRKVLLNEKDARKRAEDHLSKLKVALQLERDARKKADETLSRLNGALQTEKTSRSKAEESIDRLEGSLQAERTSKEQAEQSLTKLHATLRAGSDAQRQINENIAQLQGTVQSEREARQGAEEMLAQLQGSLQQEKEAGRHADDTLTQLQETLHAEKEVARNLEGQLAEVQGDLDEAKIDKAQAEAEVEKCRNEIKELEGAVVRAQTDLTFVRAELDGAYGTRAQRAADVTKNPAVQKEIDDLIDKNTSLQSEIDRLKGQNSGNPELQGKVELLQKELKETIEDYEQMTKASIEFEKDREQLEGSVDGLREKCEALEAQLSDEKVKWLGMKSPGVHGPGSPTTSTMVLKNEFKKMMRDTRAENMKALRAEQDERRRLEALVRSLKAEQQQSSRKAGLQPTMNGSS